LRLAAAYPEPVSTSDWIGAGGLGLALLATLWRTIAVFAGGLRRDLDACLQDRAELRGELEIVKAALIGALPREQRMHLLTQLDERVVPSRPTPDARRRRR
jgi:hypothetical protein